MSARIAPWVLLVWAAAGGDVSAATPASHNLRIHILPSESRMDVSGTFRVAPSDIVDGRLKFLLSPHMTDLRVSFVKPSVPVASLTSEDKGGDREWTVTPDRPLGRADVVLAFSYRSDGKAAPQFAIRPEGSFAGGGGELWYPQVTFKHRDTGILKFSVPVGDTVVSNGKGFLTASGTFEFRVTRPSKFGFATGRYITHRGEGRIPISLHLLRDREGAKLFCEKVARVLAILQSLFGPMPYDQLAVVEVDFPGRVVGSSEFGFILADDSKLEQFDLSYWAHEIGHQWWGNLVRTAPATGGQMLLSEGIAQFGALLSVESVDGEAAAERFRRTGYVTSGQSAASYFRIANNGTDLPLTTYVPKSQDEIMTMHALANSKGFLVLNMLSRRVGRERLAQTLRDFIAANTEQPTSWADLQRAIQRNAQEDLGWFFAQWLEREGAPSYHLTWRRVRGGIAVAVTQPPPYFRTTIDVAVRGEGAQAVLRTVEISDAEVKFDVMPPFEVKGVDLDPEYQVLRWMNCPP